MPRCVLGQGEEPARHKAAPKTRTTPSMDSHSAVYMCHVFAGVRIEKKFCLSGCYEAFKILKRRYAVLIYGNCCFPRFSRVIQFRVIRFLRPARQQTLLDLEMQWADGGQAGCTLH